MAKLTPVDLRNTIKDIIRDGRGIGTEDVLRQLKAARNRSLLADNADYLERVALVRVINEAWSSRKTGHVEGQESLFGEARYPERVSFVMLKDGKPTRVRKEFLDCTVEEAEAWVASRVPVRRTSRRGAETKELEALLARVSPSVRSGETFREALERTTKR